MITTSDIGDILFRDCHVFGLEVYRKGNIPPGEITTERVIIHTKPQSSSTYWKRGFAEINLCVPDIDTDTANLIRLAQLERQAAYVLDGVVGEHDGSDYLYSIDSIGTETDTALKCHYVNVRILFEVLNVMI